MCSLYVGVDTGAMHLAAAAGVRCVAIMAAIDSPGRWTPRGEGHHVFRTEIECEGCGLKVCPIGNKCVEPISASEVAAAALAMLRAEGP
jgi:ADP-heptose:LPS heptosyltransferase